MDKGSIPKTEDEIRGLIRSYADSGINLVHPEVIYTGYSAYPSSYLTQKDFWNGLDMLRILIDESHWRGIEVHPWVRVFYVGNSSDKGGILARHPEWAAVNQDGQELSAKGGYWVCPSIPAVRATLLGAIRELAEKYPIDGVQLDYIRFDSPEYCYNESCRTRFKAEYGIDPKDIEPFTTPVLDWHLWRENLVNSFVAEVSAELKRVRPDLRVSAAVASYPEKARLSFLQHWEHWAANRWVDFLTPMDYTSDQADFAARVNDASARIKNRMLLAPGLGLYTYKGVEPMLAQVQIARTQPTAGVTLFATAYLDKERLESLREGPFTKKAALPFRTPIKRAERMISAARDRLREDASPDGLTEASLYLAGAGNLLDYASYHSLEQGYMPPSSPPIFIPEHVVPIPEVKIPSASSPPVLDGKLDDAVWQDATRLSLDYTNLGDTACVPTEVRIVYDAENLYLAWICHEVPNKSIQAKVTERDGPLFDDDSIEIFLDVEGSARDYYHFALNAIGAKYDSHRQDSDFNPEWQAAVGRPQDAWTAEVAIPFSALKSSSPTAGATWRANFCRNRTAVGQPPEIQNTCWSPTYGSFHTPIRFGRIVFSGG
jgi:uncharacterized lipoprotein YddW (UPF0748 family)